MTQAKRTISAAPETKPSAAEPSAARRAQKRIEEAMTMTQEQFSGYSAAYAKGVEDVIELNRQALEAIVASASVAAKGYGELSESLLDFTKGQIAEGAACARAVLACKSPKEAVDIQTNYAKSAYEKSVGAGAKISEISLKTASEMMAPIGERMNETLDRLMKTRKAA